MANFKLTPAANNDLKDISRYTERKWGREQRNQYLTALDSRFRWLGENPDYGKSRDEIKEGYLCYPEGRHVIFYRFITYNPRFIKSTMMLTSQAIKREPFKSTG